MRGCELTKCLCRVDSKNLRGFIVFIRPVKELFSGNQADEGDKGEKEERQVKLTGVYGRHG